MVHTYHPNSKKNFTLQTIEKILMYDQNRYVHQTLHIVCQVSSHMESSSIFIQDWKFCLDLWFR
jgi:hypothetical protein